jgi:predicted nicotinamide N-methyase
MLNPAKHSRDYLGVTALLASHPQMRRLKHQLPASQLHGNKLWGAAYLLIDYLRENPLPTHSRVLELGCGWGLASIYCAKYFQAEVTALDADDSVFPFLTIHAEHNDVAVTTKCADFEDIFSLSLDDYDVIIASDICFWDEMSEVVFNLISHAIGADVKKIIIADPQRPPFLNMAEACVDAFFAEIQPREVTTSRHNRGSILIIENA